MPFFVKHFDRSTGTLRLQGTVMQSLSATVMETVAELAADAVAQEQWQGENI